MRPRQPAPTRPRRLPAHVTRIVTQPIYPKAVAFPVALALMRAQRNTPAHEAWADQVSILDPDAIDAAHVLGPRQLTDLCLLATAVRRGGQLVTLDARISIAAVRGARLEHLLAVPVGDQSA